ncbi:AraC family transcriptional regulator [Kamptonema cortianum]|nr:AraC family transcriptional regulator [Geitlerinema splendidum]MDK3158379.1 AraC family transcriptional regulator [Kamptonema cortianum]
MESVLVPGSFLRPFDGPKWTGECRLPVSGKPGWQSNGGHGRLHPARGLPFTCEVAFPADINPITQLQLVGVFALFTSEILRGQTGAVLQLVSDEKVVWSKELVFGQHFTSAAELVCPAQVNRDGTELRRVGVVELEGERTRVDAFTVQLPKAIAADRLVFRDTGSSASFILFDVLATTEAPAVCPFRGHAGQIPLSEIGGILRLRDYGRFSQAVEQLEKGILSTKTNLDEARGNTLTFLAIISASLLELGVSQKIHRFQLEAARKLEKAANAEQIAICARGLIEVLVDGVFGERKSSHEILMDRAIKLIERGYAQAITDHSIAEKIGVSTSHFRHLFRRRTGQPFHKYLLAYRLEKARTAILSTDESIRDIAEKCGFVSAAHFSRAFTHRFGLPPTTLRENRAV